MRSAQRVVIPEVEVAERRSGDSSAPRTSESPHGADPCTLERSGPCCSSMATCGDQRHLVWWRREEGEDDTYPSYGQGLPSPLRIRQLFPPDDTLSTSAPSALCWPQMNVRFASQTDDPETGQRFPR